MVTAYIMVKANTGDADRLLQEIRDTEGIVDAHIVAGDVDLIAKAVVETPGEVKGVVADAIQSIDGVASTQTYLAME